MKNAFTPDAGLKMGVLVAQEADITQLTPKKEAILPWEVLYNGAHQKQFRAGGHRELLYHKLYFLCGTKLKGLRMWSV